MPNNVLLPRIMEIGGGARFKAVQVLATLGARKPLILTSGSMVRHGHANALQESLQEAGITATICAETAPEPTESSLAPALEVLSRGDFDAIIALGGGSVLDAAKAVSILARFGGKMADYKFPRVVDEEGLPIIAIPSTAGTGSEVTKFTIITDQDTDEKMLCVGLGFMPVAALVDYELTLSAPARVSADTGLDALTHAIESYVSRKANAFSEIQSLAAMKLIGANLRKVYHDGSDTKAREAMMLGATLAGIGFSASSVALVHGMSRPIGAFFHVPHGLSNAMLLPTITEFSLSAAPERYADCAVALGVASPHESTSDANAKLIAELKALNTELEVPTPAAYGLDKDRYFELRETMAKQALASGSPSNNPRVPDVDELIELYTQVWD